MTEDEFEAIVGFVFSKLSEEELALLNVAIQPVVAGIKQQLKQDIIFLNRISGR